MVSAERYAVLLVLSSGPRAVVGVPWLFATRHEAWAWIAELTARHLVVHHTYLEVFAFHGETYPALDKAGIIY